MADRTSPDLTSPDLTGEINALATVVCAHCGQRFAISSRPPLENTALAVKQAAWVADQLVWDHIQERKHHGSMELPSLQ